MAISKPHIYLENWVRGTLRDPGQHFTRRTPRHCPICSFSGYFLTANRLPESRCPNCSSKERDRVFQLALQQQAIDVTDKKILHFSPERPFWRRWRHLPGYVSGDVKKNKVANTQIDVTKIQFGDQSFDLLICHHVLEHVPDDKQAMAECFRVLKSGGTAFFSVPLRDDSAETFEPPVSMPKEEVERICGWDHKRIYGQDFPGKLKAAGFEVSEVQFSSAEAERFQLRSNLVDGQSLDRVFMARK